MAAIITAAQYAGYAARNGLDPGPAGLADALDLASAEARTLSGRELSPSPATAGTTETRTYRGDGGQVLWIDDALSVSTVAIDGALATGWTCIAQYQLPIIALERSGLSTVGSQEQLVVRSSLTWPRGSTITVAARYGYAEPEDLPADVVDAIAALAALRLAAGPNLWQQAITGAQKVTVINVTIEDKPPAGTALETIRAGAERTLRGLRRIA